MQREHLRRAQAAKDGVVGLRREAGARGLVKLGRQRDDVAVEVLEGELGDLQIGVEVQRHRQAERGLKLEQKGGEALSLLRERVDDHDELHGLADALAWDAHARSAARQVVGLQLNLAPVAPAR